MVRGEEITKREENTAEVADGIGEIRVNQKDKEGGTEQRETKKTDEMVELGEDEEGKEREIGVIGEAESPGGIRIMRKDREEGIKQSQWQRETQGKGR